jgi:TrmH family RNA methyltransferase
MISKAKSKFIKSLQIKKYRKQEQCFLAEGRKSILELLNSDFELVMLVATREFLQQYTGLIPKTIEVLEVDMKELQGLGEFQSNDTGIAVARIKPNKPLTIDSNEFALVLDDIRDPGNLGTIIRTADWYGVDKIIASAECAEIYNPKVISATMGSFTRVQIFYTDLAGYLAQFRYEVFGTYLEGENIHSVKFGKGGLIVIGNESNGISMDVGKYISKRITIPKVGRAESLNAAIATAIVLDNLRRYSG